MEQWHSNHKTYPLIHWLRGRGPTGTVLLHFIRHIPSLWTLDQLPCHFSWAHLASTSHFPSASFFFCCGRITLFLQDVMRSCLTERLLRVALWLFQVLHAVYHHVFCSLVSTFNAKYTLHTPVMCRTTDYGCLLKFKKTRFFEQSCLMEVGSCSCYKMFRTRQDQMMLWSKQIWQTKAMELKR